MSRLWDSCPVLSKMKDEKLAYTPSGEARPIDSGIQTLLASALYETVTQLRPMRAIEVGMAYGTSALAILQALEDTGQECARLVSIDPFQTKQWERVGLEMIRRAGLSTRHEFWEAFDHFALPDMLKAGEQFGFAYLDGWHSFENTLLDFWYVDRMLLVGGVVAFNDCSFPAVDKVIRFVETNRKYREIDVGLPRLVADSGLRFEDRYFQKLEDYQMDWNGSADF